MKILVTGASGFIGSRFCARAIERGHEVVALIRPGREGTLPSAAGAVYGALPYDMPERAWQGVQAVVHCAAITTGKAAAQSYAVNLDGTRFLLGEARRHDAGRFIFLSSQSAHEDAVSAYGKTKLEAERVVRAGGIPYAILRPGLVVGPGKQGLFYRMRRSVGRMPLLPMLGGGQALVQPIHVDDLCTAMLTCLESPPDQDFELQLGDPRGMTLAELLQEIALLDRGKPKRQVTVPTGPIKVVVGIGEALRIPLPISSDNLRGMETVRRMDTASSLEKIRLELRPMKQAIRDSVQDVASSNGAESLRIVLVGAGKIGIVHALDLRQRDGVRLVAIADTNRKAFGMYRSMGFEGPFYTDVNEAVRAEKADGVIIATPAATHLKLARWCLERGMPAIVEKPLSVRTEDLQEFRNLAKEFPRIPFHTGYMAAQFPQLERAKDILESGRLGKLKSCDAIALQSHIMAASPVRWEMQKGKSGGGALINFALHVQSLVFRLFGVPPFYSSAMWNIHSEEVEDAFVCRMDYPGFPVRFAGSWSAPGYARPLNRIEVHGEAASLVLDNFGVSVQENGQTLEFYSQRSFDVGYNPAPDYTGAGFAAEHENFLSAIAAAKTGRPEEHRLKLPPPVEMREALGFEKWIHYFYEDTPLAVPTEQKLRELMGDSGWLPAIRSLLPTGRANL